MPILFSILRTPCILQTQTDDQLKQQKLRNCTLAILHKLSTSLFLAESFEPRIEGSLDLLLDLVRDDNEDNGVLCVNIISNVVEHQHEALAPKLQSLLSLISELFEKLAGIVTEQLDSMLETGCGANPGHQTGPLKGMQSFKVLSAGATLALSIFKAYKHAIPQGAELLSPITSILNGQAKAQEQAHKDGAANGTIFTGVSLNIENRAAFGEFIAVQVKIMSLLAYLLMESSDRADPPHLKESLPDIIVRLLKDCPGEKPGVRNELLVAFRSIVNFYLGKIFLPKIDDLLDERILIGDGLTMYETSRPLAYAALADLIDNVREDLQPNDIHKVVEVYTKNLLDSFAHMTLQLTALKLLQTMAGPITKLSDKVDARHCLMIILNAIADKFAAINQQYSNAVTLSKLEARPAAGNVQEDYLADKKHPPQWDETDIFAAGPIKTSTCTLDYLEENEFLFRNMMSALEEILNQFETLTIDPADTLPQLVDVLSTEEAHIFLKFVREVPLGFRYGFSSENSENYMRTFLKVCDYIHTAKLHEEIPNLEAMAGEHSEQPLLQGAFTAINDYKWVCASDNTVLSHNSCSADIDPERKLRRPEEFWKYLKGKLGELNCRPLIEEVRKCQILRDWGVSQVGDLINACSSQGVDTKLDTIIDTLRIFATLCSSKTTTWEVEEEHLDVLREMGEQLERCRKTDELPPHCPLAAYEATDHLEVIFTMWLERQVPEILDPLLRLFEAIATGKLRPPPKLRVIVYKHLMNRPDQVLNRLILHCLDMYASESTDQCAKRHLLRDIVNPAVAMLVQRHWQQGDANIDEAVIESIISKIWLRAPEPRINHADMEALQLSAMLVKYHHTRLRHVHKDIINFGLAYIRQDDAIVKYAAYVLIAYCIALYETPADLVKQTYLTLLERGSDECPALVLQGLRLIATVMPERCQQPLEDKNAVWAVGLRQVLAENGTSKRHMATLLEFLKGQSELFYHSRDEIGLLAIGCLYKVAPPSNSPYQSKQLAMGMMRLLWGWEQRPVNCRSTCGSGNQFVILRMIEYLIEFVLQLPHRKFPSANFATVSPAVLTEQPPSEDLHDGAMALLFNLVPTQYWGVLDAGSLDTLGKVLADDVTRAALATSADVGKHIIDKIINAFQVYCIILHVKSESWIAKHKERILKDLQRCLHSQRPEIREQVCAAEACKILDKIQSESCTLSINEKVGEGGKPPKAR